MIQRRLILPRYLFNTDIKAVYLPQVQHIVTERDLSEDEKKELTSHLFEFCQYHNPDFAERWLPDNPEDLSFVTFEAMYFYFTVNKVVGSPFVTKKVLLGDRRNEKLFVLVTDWLDSLQPNRDNVRRAIEHLRTVKQEEFSMALYRMSNIIRPHQPCDSVGCVIGHCTSLDRNVLDFYGEIKYDQNELYEDFNYHAWSISFFGVNNLEVHEYLFGSGWAKVDDSIESAIRRLELFLEHGNNLMKFIHKQISSS